MSKQPQRLSEEDLKLVAEWNADADAEALIKQRQHLTVTRAEVRAAKKALIEQGLRIDSGERRRNPRTGEMEIAWMAVTSKEQHN